MSNLANLDIREAFNKDGTLKDVAKLPDNVAKAVSSFDVSVNEDGDTIKKVRFVDRGQMIALGGRRLKMFVEKVEMSGQMSLEQAVNESIKPRE